MTMSRDKAGYAEFMSDDGFRDRDRLLAVPGMTFSSKLKKFIAPLTWPVCCASRGVFGEELQLSDEIVAWAVAERAGRIDPALEARLLLDAEGDPALYPYQRGGVQYLTSQPRSMLLDDMGTGKTIQTIVSIRTRHQRGEDVFPALVVCPNSMKLTWVAEWEKWYPDVSVAALSGSIANKRKILASNPDVVIVNWEALRTLSRLDGKVSKARLKRCVVCSPTLADIPSNSQSKCEWCPKDLNRTTWKTIVLDEAHRMKDKDAKQTRAACALRTDETTYRHALTGTVIGDTPADMWPILHFIEPTWFPSNTKYIERYCHTWYNYWGMLEILGLSPATAHEFYAIVDPLYRRMQKEVVLPFLPPKVYTQRIVPMEPKQAKAYFQIRDEMIAQLDNGHVATVGTLAQQTRLMQFSSSYAELDEAGQVKLTNPSNKITALMDVIDEAQGQSIIVFAESKQLIELAAKALEKAKITHGLIVGGQTDGQRNLVMQEFQAGRTQVVLSTIKAGGTGITLTKASIVVFLQRSWSRIENQQAEARAHRIGSDHESIQIVDIISEDTFEFYQQKVIQDKERNHEEIVQDQHFIKRLLGVS